MLSGEKGVIMEKGNEAKKPKKTRNFPLKGKIARLRYRRRHLHLFRHPRIQTSTRTHEYEYAQQQSSKFAV